MPNKKLVDIIRHDLNHRLEERLSLGIKSYIKVTVKKGNAKLIPQDTSLINVSNLLQIGGGLWNDVYLVTIEYSESGTRKSKRLVFKTYGKSTDPYDLIRRNYAYKIGTSRWCREFELLSRLDSMGFPAPGVVACESNQRFLGSPFIVMQEEEISVDEKSDFISHFARTLAQLHNLKLEDFHFAFLKTHNKQDSFARSWPLHYKEYLRLEPRHSKEMKAEFKKAIHWLDLNALRNSCPQYRLVHGDYHPGNARVTRSSRLVVLDWDSIEIGDPAFDVGYAYHFVKFFSNPSNPDSGEQNAEEFVSNYARAFDGDISARLDFYKIVGILGASIFCSSALSNPLYAYKYRLRRILPSFPLLAGILIFLGFPFIKNHVVAQKLATEGDILWLKYCKSFLSSNLKS